jgi:ribulose kinase
VDAQPRARTQQVALTADFHVYPDFYGNGSPRTDPALRDPIVGLPLSETLDDCACLYSITAQTFAHGTRQIIAAMNARNYTFDNLFACGGGSTRRVLRGIPPDVTAHRKPTLST